MTEEEVAQIVQRDAQTADTWFAGKASAPAYRDRRALGAGYAARFFRRIAMMQ